VKNLPQKFVQRHFAIAISSNYHSPIKIDEHDRRYFVPVWSEHLKGPDGKNETQAFFDDFNQWLSIHGGFQELRDWFEQVNTDDYNFRMAPDSQAKQDISAHSEPSEGRKTQLFVWLQGQRNKKMVFTSSELQKHNFPMTDVDVQQSLRQAGYVSVRRSWKMEGGSKPTYIWVPIEHKDAHYLASKGWTLWQGGGGYELELPDEEAPIEDDKLHWHEEEKQLWARVFAGEAVVINEYKHPNLKAFAEQNGTLVNIMRPSSGGTIYGNEAVPRDKSSEERDRVCDEFKEVQAKQYTAEQIQFLKGKVLMCRCKPTRCHGDTLALLANGE
jgi:hypothetical protein